MEPFFWVCGWDGVWIEWICLFRDSLSPLEDATDIARVAETCVDCMPLHGPARKWWILATDEVIVFFSWRESKAVVFSPGRV